MSDYEGHKAGRIKMLWQNQESMIRQYLKLLFRLKHMTAANVRPVAIKIDEDITTRVKRLADARQRTSHWLMRETFPERCRVLRM
jgi:hypothetical protein